MKKTTKSLRLVTIIFIIMLLSSVTVVAWFSLGNSIDPNLDKATIVKQYFHTGDGSEEDPFVITRPIHFYNLVELYQRKDGFAEAGYHFQLGYDLDGSGELKFYGYGDDGKQIKTGDGRYTTELNMQYYSGNRALIPIGTSDVPFDAAFDGSDLTVKNLYIKPTETINDTVYGSSDVGIWGYVGPDANVHNVYFDNVTIDLTNTDPTRTTEGHNVSVHDEDENGVPELVYVGFLAGHIHTASTFEDVYINNCTITGGDAARSGYGYFGCVENANGELIQTLGSEIATLRAKGDDAGFGGSIKMKSTFQRLMAMFNEVSGTTSTYVSSETRIVDEVEGGSDLQHSETKNYSNAVAYPSSNITYRYYYSPVGGSLFFPSDNDTTETGNGNKYECLFGESSIMTNTVTTYTYKDEFTDAWYIRDGNNYLSVNGTTLSTAANQGSAVKWLFDGRGHLYTVVEEATTYRNYYLNRDGTGGLTLGTAANTATVWNHTSSDADTFNSDLYTSYNSTNYYVDYNGGWVITPYNSYYKISAGGNHFLNANTTAVSDSGTADGSVKWYISDPTGSTTTISTYINGTAYYLYNDGELKMSTTPTQWTKEGNAYYSTVQGVKYYLVYDSAWKVLPATGNKITDGSGNYLTATTSAVGNGTLASSVVWQFSSETGDTQIYTVFNGQKYYLTYDNGLTVSTTASTWHRSGDSFYYTSGNKDYYLEYDGGWTVKALDYFVINDGSGNYLRVTGANAFANGNESNATHFYFTTENGANSSGRVYCNVGANTYYLYNNNGTLQTTTTQNTGTQWQNDGNSLFVTSGNTKYALQYDSGWKIKTIIPGKLITDGNGNYLRITGTGTTNFENTTDVNLATRFTFSNDAASSGTILANVNGSNRYLRNNDGSLQVSTTSTTWSNDGSNLYNGNYYLAYLNGEWTLSPKTYYLLKSGNYYMTNTSGTTLGASTSSANAVRWETTSGNIKQVGTDYYLYSTQYNNGTVSLNTTARNWTNSNNRLSWVYSGWFNNTTYYLQLNGTSWRVRTNSGNASTVTFETVTLTQQSHAVEPDNTVPTVKVAPMTDPAPTVGVVNAGSAGTSLTLAGPSNEQLTFEKTTRQTIEKVITTENGGRPTYFPIRVDKTDEGNWPDGYAVSPKNTGYIVSGAHLIESSATVETQKKWGDIRISGFTIDNISDSYSTTGLTVTRICYNGNYLTLTKDANDEYQISNTTNGDAALYWQYSGNKLFTTVGKNTYYLTNVNNTLTLTTDPGVNWTYNTTNARLSNNNYYIQYYNNAWTLRTTTQNLTLDLGTLGTIYTVDDSGNHALTAAQQTDVYKQAALQLTETLVGSTRVFGLHFMDAQISTEHLIKADYVSIFNTPYEDYELPEDSIDFHVIERGSINFFAGEYFDNNNAFFSLHKVFRYTAEDPEVKSGEKKVNDIKDIKEIEEVYRDSALGERANYIYRFSDGTYTDVNGGYTGATTLATGYVSAFKLSWIKAPTGITSGGNKMYYFEIPCNDGEYCLGSVSGKTGAYLMYLDIAANGGDTIASAVSSTGNDVVESFKVEYRDNPDVMNSTVLQFSIDAPDNVSASDFSVNVQFDKTANDAPHTKGLYTITVVNKSTEDLTLFVYLCDDDFNVTTPFQYAYRVVYTNSNRTDTVIQTPYGENLQVMAGFNIPASGDAEEISYH